MNDFYSFINKDWFKSTQLNDDQSRTGTFDCISRVVKKQLYKIILEEQTKKSFLGNFYSKLLTEEVCLECFGPYLDDILNIKTMRNYYSMISKLSIYGYSIFYDIYVSRDVKNPNQYILAYESVPSSLPDSSYYDTHENDYREFLNIYCIALGIKPNNIFDLENEIRKLSISAEEKRDFDVVYNKLSKEEFLSMLPNNGIDVMSEYKKHQLPDFSSVCVCNKKHIKNIFSIIEKYDIETLKCYMVYKAILSLPHLCKPKNIVDLEFNFFMKKLRSITKQKSRKTDSLRFVIEYIPDLLDKIYLEKHMLPEDKQMILDISQLIKLSTKDIIHKCSWISSTTKERIYEKIDSMNIKVGGTTVPKTYDEYINVLDLPLLQMILELNKFQSIENFKKLGTDVDKRTWSMSSFSVNAYYSPLNNEIVIPCAILHKPFYSNEMSIYENLGGIGSVIGHEISHGFDDQGRQFDKDGFHRVWWLEEDIKKFNKKTKQIKDYYEQYYFKNVSVSGKLTIGENIADYTGILILTNILNINSSNYTSYAIMYKQYAKVWRQKIRESEMVRRILNDPHAPPRLRTNVVLSHIPEFKRIFNLNKDHSMYIPDNKQFSLWK